MNEALKEAIKASIKLETPIGAVMVKDGKIIARGHNEKELKQDCTLHAEINAIRKASHKLGSWRLIDCDMYVTLEPCTMCAGAIIHARVKNLFIGTSDPKAGAVGLILNVLEIEALNHRVEVVKGVLEYECSQLLKGFFKSLRVQRASEKKGK